MCTPRIYLGRLTLTMTCLLLLLRACASTSGPASTSTPVTISTGVLTPPASSTTKGLALLVYRGHAPGAVIDVAWSPDGRRLVSGGLDMTAQVWDATSGQSLETYTSHRAGVEAVVWSPDGTRIATGSGFGEHTAFALYPQRDNSVQVWDAATGHRLLTYRGHHDWVFGLAWSPDGRRIASSSWDQTVQVWDATSGHTMLIYRGHHGRVNLIAWSPDGRGIASASQDGTVQVWDASTGRTLLTYRGLQGWVWSVAWSPDGRYIASGGGSGPYLGGQADDRVQVWDAASGQTLYTYAGQSSDVNSVSWSPDGKRIASASNDGTVQIWDAFNGAHVYTYTGHTRGGVDCVAWSPDGKRIASGGDDATVQVWQPA